MAGIGAPWQLDCENMEQRCGYLLTSGIWSDCTFMVGSETNQELIQAHKLVLAMASPVFEAMFFGVLSERKDPIITIPDVQPEAFRALLEYIYTGNIKLDSLSLDTACDLWYGADKYMLPLLVNKCTNTIISAVGPSNACRVYELARLFDEKTVMDKCLQIISTKTKEVLNDSSFEDVGLNTVITVCSLDHLNVDSELELFRAVDRYAKAEQRRKTQVLLQSVETSSQTSPAQLLEKSPVEVTPSGPTVDKDNVKEEKPSIRTALQSIRFLSMSAEEFAEGPAVCDLLTKDQILALLMNISSKDSPVAIPTGFSKCREKRQPHIDSWQQRYKPGSLDYTINALKFGSPAQIKEEVRAAIGILFVQDLDRLEPSDIQPALDKGILEALVPALTEGDDQCKYDAVVTICALCARGSPSQLGVLAASAALQPYCRLLAARFEDTCYFVVQGLTLLLKNVERNAKAGLLLKMREIGVPKLLMTARDDGVRGHEIAGELLRTYFQKKK